MSDWLAHATPEIHTEVVQDDRVSKIVGDFPPRQILVRPRRGLMKRQEARLG
ncbi:hypothetical protein [Streptomyces sp. NPDC058667]|uniref:hypothetical protein n=1 Tax=Streptomyces sp. NPDC058667 TaxID=3346588 RepID=UPI00365B6519